MSKCTICKYWAIWSEAVQREGWGDVWLEVNLCQDHYEEHERVSYDEFDKRYGALFDSVIAKNYPI